MKIALITQHKRGGVVEMARPVAQGLTDLFHDVSLFLGTTPSASTLNDYALVHFFNVGTALQYQHLQVPVTVTIHHISHPAEQWYVNALHEVKPQKIICLDYFTVRHLGRLGFTNTRRVNQVLDVDKWKVLPAPDEFAIGWLGGDAKFKRFDVIETIADELDIPCYGHDSQPWITDEAILDLYGKISCYVVASFEDGGPLPAQEMLLCGRPVVTTNVGNMPDVILDDKNGLFYDGSVADGRSAVTRIRQQYGRFRRNVIAKRYLVADSALAGIQYSRIFTEVLEQWNRSMSSSVSTASTPAGPSLPKG